MNAKRVLIAYGSKAGAPPASPNSSSAGRCDSSAAVPSTVPRSSTTSRPYDGQPGG